MKSNQEKKKPAGVRCSEPAKCSQTAVLNSARIVARTAAFFKAWGAFNTGLTHAEVLRTPA